MRHEERPTAQDRRHGHNTRWIFQTWIFQLWIFQLWIFQLWIFQLWIFHLWIFQLWIFQMRIFHVWIFHAKQSRALQRHPRWQGEFEASRANAEPRSATPPEVAGRVRGVPGQRRAALCNATRGGRAS